jgi:hypothetical protein
MLYNLPYSPAPLVFALWLEYDRFSTVNHKRNCNPLFLYTFEHIVFAVNLLLHVIGFNYNADKKIEK